MPSSLVKWNVKGILVWGGITLSIALIIYFLRESSGGSLNRRVVGSSQVDGGNIQLLPYAPVIHQCPIHGHAGLHIEIPLNPELETPINPNYGSPYWICPDDYRIRWSVYTVDQAACGIDQMSNQVFISDVLNENDQYISDFFSIRPRSWWDAHVDDWESLMGIRDTDNYDSSLVYEVQVYENP